jgi:hypothetical protein
VGGGARASGEIRVRRIMIILLFSDKERDLQEREARCVPACSTMTMHILGNVENSLCYVPLYFSFIVHVK